MYMVLANQPELVGRSRSRNSTVITSCKYWYQIDPTLLADLEANQHVFLSQVECQKKINLKLIDLNFKSKIKIILF